MSARATDAVWNGTDQTTTEKFILLALADGADRDGVALSTVKRLQKLTGFSGGGVRQAIARMEKSGLLAVSHVDPRIGPSRYAINIED